MNQKQDPAKRMQTIGIILLTGLFGAWLFYQSQTNLEKAEQSSPQPEFREAAEPNTVSPASKELRLAESGPETTTEARPNPSSAGENTESPESTNPDQARTPEDGQTRSLLIVETDVYRAELDPMGAVMRSLILKKHQNNGQPLEMVRSVGSQLYPFTVYLGDYNDGQAVMLPFQYEQLGERSYRFFAEFYFDQEDDPYILEKHLEFARDEYMVKVSVRLQRKSGKPLPQNSRRVIYSLYYGPQMGPEVDHIGSNRTSADMRSYVYFNGKKSRTVSLNRASRDKRLDSSPIWGGISGKYFGTFGLPSHNLDIYWSGADVPGLGLDASGKPLESSQFLFERRAASNRDNLADDTFYYYIGPLLADTLNIFNKSADNEFGLADASLNSLVKFSLGFIEEPVKWSLTTLYGFTHNYGIAIILFALLVRILLYPLMLKSFKSTSRMRLIQPQMKELQERHKSDPKRLQQEMAALYRKEKVNPVGGCLPLLVQMPILIAIANLFYRYFELRGASFIPGWIGDLSSPDLVYALQLGSWDIPLRLLPIIYLASQLISSKLMQANQPPMQNKLQQRMFTVYMPIFFSIILYSMPSGLILYWTISNILTTTQQLLMNKFLQADTLAVKHEADAVIAQQNRNYIRHTSKRKNLQKDQGGSNPEKAGESKKNSGKKGKN